MRSALPDTVSDSVTAATAPGPAPLASPAPVIQPVVAADPVLTSSPDAPLRWVLPGLLVVALLAAAAGAVLPRTPRRPTS